MSQTALVEIVRRRISDIERKRVRADVLEAQQEFSEGHRRPASPDELIHKILS